MRARLPVWFGAVVGSVAATLGTWVAPASAQELREDAPAAKPPDPARIEAEPIEPPPPPGDAPDTPWEHWLAGKEAMREDIGFWVALNVDLVFRSVVTGPETGINKAVARYDLLLRQDVGEDGRFSMDVRGGWGDGIDPHLDLFANTDQFARTEQDIFVLHLYYQHEFLDDQLVVRLGKFDIGDWIDTNRYGFYNFLGYAFAHNAAIPLTGNTLGAMASYEPTDGWWYVQGGASNATQTPFETGYSSTFESDADWLTIAELGLKPTVAGREGVYRFIAWHNSLQYTTTAGTTERGATGFALSFDQDLTDRLGVFFRFGVADGDPFEPDRSWSAGFLLAEPLPGRPDDSFAVGVVHNEFTDAHDGVVEDAADSETYVEIYYNHQLTPWIQLQPVIQIVDNPGGLDRDTAVIGGVHVAFRF